MTHEELKKLLLLLRKNGVLTFEQDGLKLAFHEDAMKLEKPADPPGPDISADSKDKWAGFPTSELTPEQLMFYSAGGRPEDDPENRGDA